LSTEVELRGEKYFQLGASVNPGNSGGPVLDSNGEVIGVVTARAKEEAIGFCIPAEVLATVLKTLNDVASSAHDKLGGKHDMQAVFLKLRSACMVYSQALEVYVSSMEKAMRRGETASDGIRDARATIGDRLILLDRMLLRDIRAELPRLIQDSEIHLDLRPDLNELVSTYSELKSYAEEPRGTFESFVLKAVTLKDRCVHLLKRLELELGVEEED
jgi:hypothetical protein